MWSDQTPPAHLRELVATLHSILPPPSPTALDTTQNLRGSASPDQLAERLHLEPGFAWLDGGSTKHFLFHRPLITVSCQKNSAIVSGQGKTIQFAARGIDVLDAMLHAWSGPANARLVGFTAYDLASEIEQLDSPSIDNDFNFPTLHFGLFDSFFEFDQKTSDQNSWTFSGTDAWKGSSGLPVVTDHAETLIDEAGRLSVPSEIPRESLPNSLTIDPLLSRPDRAFFEAAVARIVRRIHNGDFFQTNLCRRLEAPLEKEQVWELYRRMRSVSPAQYGAFLNIGDGQAVLSVSPELFLKVRGDLDDRHVESCPIKGTRPRGVTAQDDQALAAELIASEKDRAELAMIVDVVRNDLSRVCETGSVKVIRHAELMTLPTVHHTVSTISGRLRRNATISDLFRATFPAASITGAPKIEAMRAAMHEEGQRRGPCMGSIGWISLDGRMELSVAIRTAFATEGRVFYYTGCGITADSIPQSEFEESRHKALAFVRALGVEHLGHW